MSNTKESNEWLNNYKNIAIQGDKRILRECVERRNRSRLVRYLYGRSMSKTFSNAMTDLLMYGESRVDITPELVKKHFGWFSRWLNHFDKNVDFNKRNWG